MRTRFWEFSNIIFLGETNTFISLINLSSLLIECFASREIEGLVIKEFIKKGELYISRLYLVIEELIKKGELYISRLYLVIEELIKKENSISLNLYGKNGRMINY